MSDLNALLERFRRGAELLAMAMTGAAGSEVDFVPAPGKWSVRQLVCHLCDTELVASTRYRLVLAEDRPPICPFNQDAWAANLDYAKRKPSQTIETFRRLRGENYELLKDLPAQAFERVGIHPQRGEVKLTAMVELFTNHVEKHCAHIRDVRAAYKLSKAAARPPAASSSGGESTATAPGAGE